MASDPYAMVFNPYSDATDSKLEPHQLPIIEACMHGRLVELQGLLEVHNIQRDDTEVVPNIPDSNNLLKPMRMFYAAVKHNQPAILEYLLTVYPKIDLKDNYIADCIIKNKQLDILRLVVQQSPEIGSLENDDHACFLTRLTHEGQQIVPLIEYLLDNGVPAQCDCVFDYAWIALHHRFPARVIKKMFDAGNRFSSYNICTAIVNEQRDTVQLCLDRSRAPFDDKLEQCILRDLEKCKDRQIVDMVEKRLKQNHAKSVVKNKSKVTQFCERLMQIRVTNPFHGLMTAKEQTPQKPETKEASQEPEMKEVARKPEMKLTSANTQKERMPPMVETEHDPSKIDQDQASLKTDSDTDYEDEKQLFT